MIDVKDSGDSSLIGSNTSDNYLMENFSVSGSGDSGGVKKLSLTSVGLFLQISGSSANMLRNQYSSVTHSSNSVVMITSLGLKHFSSRLYWISGMCPMCMLQYI